MIGVIADDLTGATDIASVLVERGYRTAVIAALDGRPDLVEASELAGLDAAVVALKSRTAPAGQAVASSLAAHALLSRAGADRFYFKYCSTFDSTPAGNIGPVMDALLDATGSPATIVSPAYPATARTVYQRHLFVGGQLLEQSPMRTHPLTPMRDSDLRVLLEPQSTARVESVPLGVVRGGDGDLRGRITELRSGASPTDQVAIVVDAIDESDLAAIAGVVGDWPLLTGSAGLASHLPALGTPREAERSGRRTRRLILSASASSATRGQVAAARSVLPSIQLDVEALARDADAEAERLIGWAVSRYAETDDATPLLIYSVGPDDPDVDAGTAALGDAIERALGHVALELSSAGAHQLIVAGGETSGAVVRQLGMRTLTVGASAAPGVPWMSGRLPGGPTVDIILKSGNFGRPDLFTAAWDLL